MSQEGDPTMPVGHQVEEMLLGLEFEWTLGLGSPGVLGGISSGDGYI